MKYLLDTNVFLFLITRDLDKISAKQKLILNDFENKLYLSEASYFEISIKVRLEKQNFSHIRVDNLEAERKRFNITFLKNKPEHYTNIPKVPKVYISDSKLHGDPFDLLIISQAIVEQLPVLSSDRLFPHYQGFTTIS